MGKRWQHPWVVFGLYALVSILIRLPFFFRDYVDRDESTFLLMGQAWVDGHLPYTVLWDVKPPLTFLFYAVVIGLFGKSFFMLRLVGALIVALTAWLTYKLAAKHGGFASAFIGGMACIYLQSLFGSIQGVMSEHILMCVFMGGCYFLVRHRRQADFLLAGFLFGGALMIKINIAFPLLLIGIWLVWRLWDLYRPAMAIALLAATALSGVLVVVLTVVPYLQTGQPELWWNSVVLAPLGYTEGKGSSLLAMVGINGLLAGFVVWVFATGRLKYSQPELVVMGLAVLGVVLSFIKAGRVNTHYLIQVYPPLLVLLAVLWQQQRLQKRWSKLLLGLALLLPVESYLEYYQIVRHKAERGTWYNGEGFNVPAYLKEAGVDTENILFLEYNIGYWVLGEYPPTKAATHPSNLCKAEMFPYYNAPRTTAMEELHYLMDSVRPPVVVTRLNRLIFDKTYPRENAYMDSLLLEDYTIAKEVDQGVVHLRKPGR